MAPGALNRFSTNTSPVKQLKPSPSNYFSKIKQYFLK